MAFTAYVGVCNPPRRNCVPLAVIETDAEQGERERRPDLAIPMLLTILMKRSEMRVKDAVLRTRMHI